MPMKTETSTTTRESAFSLFTDEQLKWLQKARKFADAVPLSEVIRSDAENIFRIKCGNHHFRAPYEYETNRPEALSP